MKHTMTVSIAKNASDNGIVRCRQVGIRERVLRLLFGRKERVTILVPGDSVESLAIKEVPEGGES